MLKSTDPDVIKNARAVVKGKITCAVNSINALVKDTAGKFDHGKISRTNALSTHYKLVANLELVKNLHEIFCIHRERGKDDTSEDHVYPLTPPGLWGIISSGLWGINPPWTEAWVVGE